MKSTRQLLIKSGIVLGALGLSLLATRPAEAVPSFARQTGMACEACHTVFPELTPFGRLFKLNGYTISNIQSITATTPAQNPKLMLSSVPPLAAMIQFSDTHLSKQTPDTGFANSKAQNDTFELPQQLSFFYAGAIAPKLGAFTQITYDNEGDHFSADNTDIRFADQGMMGSHNFIYGVTANNNPTIQDVWNTTPAFGYPYTTSNQWVGEGPASQVDGTMAQTVIGVGPYIYIPDVIAGGSLYAEVDGYRSAQVGAATYPLDSQDSAVISSIAPYWRLAWEKDWGRNSLEIGTYGYAPHEYNNNGVALPLSGATDDYLDVAGDAQYQYIGTNNIFSVEGTGIHEDETWNESHPNGATDNSSDSLNTVRITGSWYYQRRYGGNIGFFDTWGSTDATLYGTRTGKPDTNGIILQADYMPWENTRLLAQYTIYNKYNGASSNYDGTGRNASDNNVLFIEAWIAF